MTPTEIIFLIFVILFAILVVYLAVLIVKLYKILNAVHDQLELVENEPKEILQNVNNITADINSKIRCIDPLFRIVSNVGEALECKTAHFKESSFWHKHKAKLETPTHESPQINDLVEFAALGLNLWQKYKNRR